jgi:MazG family protein
MDYPELARAIKVVARLRDPESGCPWDLQQTHASLLRFLIEESYEYSFAVEQNNKSKMQEELGDLLLQVLLHAQLAQDQNDFNIEDVAKTLADKMIRRHPHVFEDPNIAKTPEEVKKNWLQIKAKEQNNRYHIRTEDAYAPSLHAADKIGAKSQAVNFDWDHLQDVMSKVDEELAELKVEIQQNNPEKIFEEMGDFLFSIAQLARHLDFSPEQALKAANLKFVQRINQLEDQVRADGHEMTDLSTQELEVYWAKVKQLQKTNSIP